MENNQGRLHEEEEYLRKTVELIEKKLEGEEKDLIDKKTKLLASRKEMWEDSAHFSSDFMKLTEMNQHLSEVNNQTATYISNLKHIEKYKRMKETPYFGRFDFKEDGYDDIEKIYIGLSNLMETETQTIYVYDWRASISSIFYQYELGKAAYNAPIGNISGEVLLKRQYKIQDSKLKYFFDSSIKIDDEILQEVLCHNSSAKMRNIVETIQKEQDVIIRDVDNELLIVQGVAGSGKTSIALHRIAFLLYYGLNTSLTSKNFLIISPNSVFSKYISNVLPELGEDNVNQITFEELGINFLADKIAVEGRGEQLEAIIASQDESKVRLRKQSMAYKGSSQFTRLLDRLLEYYEHHMIYFEDIYYNNKMIETKQQLKNFFLNNKINIPAANRLKRIEKMIFDKIHPLKKDRMPRIEKIVKNMGGHEFEIKSFSRLLSLKEFKIFAARVRKFTEIDYLDLYKLLFNQKGILKKLSFDLDLPDQIEQIIEATSTNLKEGHVCYEDCAPLLYLKLKLEGSNLFSEVRHVVIDEAQDYYPMQYEVIKLLLKHTRYTVLGDINQSIEKEGNSSGYDEIINILHKNKTVRLELNKSYRSSYEINAFNRKLLGENQDFISFERHEAEPQVIFVENQAMLDRAIADDISYYQQQGYGSIAIICKTLQETKEAYMRLKNITDLKMLDTNSSEIVKGAMIVPSYMAKGLEFDVVLVYDVSRDNYSNGQDKKLLYIACTRALHRLALYYRGDKCSFI